MEHTDRAGFAGYSESWADDHVEVNFSLPRALELAGTEDELETTDDEWFEDDLLSLIQNRPSRHTRSPASPL